jgi:hypothetical protein
VGGLVSWQQPERWQELLWQKSSRQSMDPALDDRDRLDCFAHQELLSLRPLSSSGCALREKARAGGRANMLLQVIWHLLAQRKTYSDLGADYFDRLNRDRLRLSLLRRLEKLGQKVSFSTTLRRERFQPVMLQSTRV